MNWPQEPEQSNGCYDDHDILQYWLGLSCQAEKERCEQHLEQCRSCFTRYLLVMRDHRVVLPERVVKLLEPSADAIVEDVPMPVINSVADVPQSFITKLTTHYRTPLLTLAAGLFLLVVSSLGYLVIFTPNQSLPRVAQRSAKPATIEAIRELVKAREYDQAEALLPAAMEAARRAGDIAGESELLYLNGRLLSDQAVFDQAIFMLQEANRLAVVANRPDLEVSPTLVLANTYHILDNNVQAREYAAKVVELATRLGRPVEQMAGLQMLGLSEFMVSRSTQAEEFLQRSLILAQQHQNSILLAHSLAYLGVVRTGQRRFNEAEAYFLQALALADKVAEPKQQARVRMMAYGYYARTQALARKHAQAADYYRQAIVFARQANTQQSLLLSQLHQGLYEALMLQGQRDDEAREAMALYKHYEEEASQRCERTNTFMSFAIARKPLVCGR
ncbi:MAG: tetratricopeptide repeat protein [Acidobacteriota bacterium]